MASLFILILLAGLVAGIAVGWLMARPTITRLRAEALASHAVQAERTRAFQVAEDRLRDTFQALSAEALRQNNQQFLQLAETRLQQTRSELGADIEARRKAIADLVSPLTTTLEKVDRELKESERHRIEGSARLLERIAALDGVGQDLRAQTMRLVDALKRPGVRGRWGELQLKRVVELAGMLEHCDFDEQQSIADLSADRRLRPDLIVHLPGGRHIVVDAKAPLDAYLKALEAGDDAARQTLLADHARQVRVHLTQLASKGYAAHVQPSPDFVVMFLPGEMFFSAALEQDPGLLEFGVSRDTRVIPASPSTLIALLRAVAYGWQQQAMEENARKISELGHNLYGAVTKLGSHFDTLGLRLKSTLDAYNQAVGSLEGNVLVKARKLKEYQATTAAEDIGQLEPIDRVPRMLQAAELTDGLPFVHDAEASEEVAVADVASHG